MCVCGVWGLGFGVLGLGEHEQWKSIKGIDLHIDSILTMQLIPTFLNMFSMKRIIICLIFIWTVISSSFFCVRHD